MGDRASYAIRRPGSRKVDVRYAHFGSPFLFGDVFWGPQHAQAMIESLEPGPWLDDVYGEAAVAMCLKSRKVAIYTCQLSPSDAALAARLMRPLWPGWEVRFVTRLTEVTPTVGVDLVKQWVRSARRGAAARRKSACARDPLAQLGRIWAADWLDCTFEGVLTRIEGGKAVDYLSDVALGRLLFVGPALLDALSRLPTVEAAGRSLEARRRSWKFQSPADFFTSFGARLHACFDVSARRLVISVEPGLPQSQVYAEIHAVEIAWPDWSLAIQVGDLDAHYRASARSLPAIFRKIEEKEPVADETEKLVEGLRLIRTLLLDADERKQEGDEFLAAATSEIAAQVEAKVATGTEVSVEINPGLAEHTPPSVLSAEEKLRLWEQALRETGLGAEAARAAEPAEETPPRASPDELLRKAHLAYQYGNDPERAWSTVEELLAIAPRHARGLALAGRLAAARKQLAEARRYSEAALELEPNDAQAWATLGLVAYSTGNHDEQVRCYTRAIAIEPHPWMVNNLACTLLERAEHERDPGARQALLERALAAIALAPRRDSTLYWAEACAHSMLGADADRAYEAIANALRAHQGNREELGKKLLADPQLAWVWEQKQGRLPEIATKVASR